MNKDRLQLTFAGWHLGWTIGRGCPLWIPHRIQEYIIKIWNPIICFFTGHYLVGEMSNGLTCTHCYNCSKETIHCNWCEWYEKQGKRRRCD